MALYGDLDVSVIDTLPTGRLPIHTVAITESRRNELLEKVKNLIALEQRQVYWVCTLIDESETLTCEAAEATHLFLQQALPEYQIACIHGKISSDEKKKIMHLYKKKKIDVLVATTVIEVGVDVPECQYHDHRRSRALRLGSAASAERSRGRGTVQSYCILLHKSPLSTQSYQRLNALRESNDGFVIAQKDLRD